MRHASVSVRAAIAGAVVVAAGISALAFGALRASAQRPMTPPDFGPYLNRYGTRWVVGVPALGGQRPTASLHVANAGWVPTDIAVVVLSAGGRADCASAAPRPLQVRCVRALAPKAAVDIDVDVPGDENVFVYSVAPGSADTCGALDALSGGTTSIAAFETDVWKRAPGEPIAVLGAARSGDLAVGLTASGTTGLSELYKSLPGGGGRRAQTLPQILAFAPGSGGRTMITNADANCARTDVRAGVAGSAPTCTLPATSAIEIAPFAAAVVAANGGPAGPHALAAYAAEETIAGANWRDDDGWAAFSAVGPREMANNGSKLAFPLAMAGLTNERSELWVTNMHPTATAQIDINMWDANGSLLRFHGDSEGICPGGTKRYDISAIAGAIPPLGGADVPVERQGPKFLSLRVESKNLSLATAPPIAGAVILRGDEGVEAVPGLALPLILARASGRQVAGADAQRPRGEAFSLTVLPGVMNQYGPDRRTTTIAVTLIGNANAENAAAADIYDAAGTLVIAGVGVRGSTATGYLDLSRPMRVPGGQADPPAQPFRLPAGFIGTVVLRSPQGRGATFGAVAITRPMQPNGRPVPPPASGEAFEVQMGGIVPLFADPTQPTRTPAPTRAIPTATAPGGPTSGVPPTAAPTSEATPTAGGGTRSILWLPTVLNAP